METEMTTRFLDACLRPEHLPAQPAFAVLEADFPETQRVAVQDLIERVFPRALEHLLLPPEVCEMEGRRGLWLWGLLNVSAARDGSDLRAEHVCAGAEPCAATANLSQPISPFGFAAAFATTLVAEAEACDLPPDALEGPAGKCLRGVLARTFHRCIDWDRLRRSVLSQLRVDSPADGIIGFEPFDTAWGGVPPAVFHARP
jgi:hypothetical protein